MHMGDRLMGLEVVIIFFLPHTHILVSSVDAVKKQKTNLITVFCISVFCNFSEWTEKGRFSFFQSYFLRVTGPSRAVSHTQLAAVKN
jgi:hypothetical protein